MDGEEFPALPASDFMENNVSVVLNHGKQVMLDSLVVTKAQAAEIEGSTRLQSQDPKWHKIRQERVTASIAGDIVRRKKGMKIS